MIKEIPNGSYEIIQGLKCWIPPVPELETIQGFFLPKEDQVWSRTEVPDFSQDQVQIFSNTKYPEDYRLSWNEARREEIIGQTGFDPLNRNRHKKRVFNAFDEFYVNPFMDEFRNQEYDRLENGHWFLNNGKPVYLTGDYYFYLNYWKLDTGYPDFRDTDRQLFYFWEYCKMDPNCYGLIEITKRGQGKSYRMGAVAFRRCVGYRGANVGIQSKNDEDAKFFFQKKVVEPYKSLPEFLVPVHNHGTEPKNILSFFPRSSNLEGNTIATRIDAIRSTMDYRASTEKAYDSTTLKFLVQDEIAKLDPAIGDAQKRLGVNKDTVYRDSKMIGKIWASSTVEDMGKGGRQAEIIFRQSNLNKRSANGRTESGLYPFFLSALDCTYFDRYGYPKRSEAKKFHDAERANKINDPIEYNGYIQRNPYTIDEAFLSRTDNPLYNMTILNERKRLCDELNFTTRGDFVWVDGKKFGKAEFVSNPDNGKWEVSWLFPDDSQANNVAVSEDLAGFKTYKPLNRHITLAYDPFSHANTVFDKKKSKAGITAFRDFDFWDDEFSDTFIADYVFRHMDPEMTHEDLICACFYYGAQFLAENQKNDIERYCIENGVYDFMMMRPQFTLPKGGQITAGIPSSVPVVDQYMSLMQTHVQNKGYKLKHGRIIRDIMDFSAETRWRLDLGVAAHFNLIAAAKPFANRFEESKEKGFEVSLL